MVLFTESIIENLKMVNRFGLSFFMFIEHHFPYPLQLRCRSFITQPFLSAAIKNICITLHMTRGISFTTPATIQHIHNMMYNLQKKHKRNIKNLILWHCKIMKDWDRYLGIFGTFKVPGIIEISLCNSETYFFQNIRENIVQQTWIWQYTNIILKNFSKITILRLSLF